MNHKSWLYSIGLVLLTIMLCMNVTGVSANSGEKVIADGNVFTVYPNGADDTANIQQAFDLAKAVGPGSTVQLAAGHFRMGFVEVWDFEGYFKGAGQGVTVIDTFENMECQALIDNNQFPALFTFMRGYPRISDLSFQITPYSPCRPYHLWYVGPDWLGTNIVPLVVSTSPWNRADNCLELRTEPVSASIERVTIEGADGARPNGENDPISSNVMESIYLGGMWAFENTAGTGCRIGKFAVGEFRVVQSTFRYAFLGVTVFGLYDSQAMIGGSPTDGNRFENILYGTFHNNLSGSRLEFSYNRMDRIYYDGIYTLQGGGEAAEIQTATEFAYLHNEITVQDYGNGIFLSDNDNLGTSTYASTGSRINAQIKNNRLHLLGEYVWGIWLEGVDDAQITNNTITGSSDKAILTGMWGPTRRALIKGNNLDNYSAYDGSPVKILLDWGTENYQLVGVSADEILDYGTNNVVGGQGPMGHNRSDQAVRAAMSGKIGTIMNLRGGFVQPEQ